MSIQSKKTGAKPILAGLCVAAVATSFSLSASALANPFEVTELESGYELAHAHADKQGKHGEGKCGEGKCGGEKDGEGKDGEGKCGGEKDGEGKCGEGKCGS